MTYEPSSLEVYITLLAGALGGGVYRTYVNSLDLKGNERILDFGSGSGNAARYLASRLQAGGGRLTCVDISRRWMKIIQKRLKRFSNVEYKLGQIGTLDIPAASQDVIFIHFVLHDIPAHDRAQNVHHLLGKLVPGGKVFVREPLQFISADQVCELITSNGLVQENHQISAVPTQGQVYQSVFRKPAA